MSSRRKRRKRGSNKNPCIPLPIVKESPRRIRVQPPIRKKPIYVPRCPHDALIAESGILNCDECGMRAVSYLASSSDIL